MTWWRRVLMWFGFGAAARSAESHAKLMQALDDLQHEMSRDRGAADD